MLQLLHHWQQQHISNTRKHPMDDVLNCGGTDIFSCLHLRSSVVFSFEMLDIDSLSLYLRSLPKSCIYDVLFMYLR